MFNVATWIVAVRDDDRNKSQTYRVPETKLYEFLSVLVFNRREFNVSREREEVDPDV